MSPASTDSAPAGARVTAQAIDALLPQTQCTRCGYAGCRPYAEAIAAQTAGIDQCPPGGAQTITALARLLGVAERPLNPAFGSPLEAFTVARVIEADCIGCFKCVLACPVDAIVGAPKFMHTVIAAQCSGCDLCLPVCPTDCIEMVPRAAELPSPAAMAAEWRLRFEQQVARRAGAAEAEDARRREHRTGRMKEQAASIDIDAAIGRSRSRRTGA